MEANAKKPKAKARPKLNPTENAALKRLEHDLITDDGIVPATKGRHAIHCLTVIGTIEGHTLSPDAQKTTKYEHVIPQLVDIEEDPEIEGLLVILNTVGGDVEAGRFDDGRDCARHRAAEPLAQFAFDIAQRLAAFDRTAGGKSDQQPFGARGIGPGIA